MAIDAQLHWQLLLCVAIVVGSVTASLWTILRKKKKKDTHADAVQPWTDGAASGFSSSTGAMWRSGVHPAWLLALRATATAALAAVLLWDLRTYDPTIMMYYTEWVLSLEIVYFGVATLFSAYGCFVHTEIFPSEQANNESLLLCSSPTEIKDCADKGAGRCFARFMQIVYQVCGGAVVLTDVVFWAIIVPFISSAHFSFNAVMGCMHSFNLVFLLAETALNCLAFPWSGIAYFLLWTCSYVIIQWIVHVCGLTWWPYPFLNPTAPWSPLWYFSMALLHLPCYIVYWWIASVKNRCRPLMFPQFTA